ncbi:MAG: glucosaminidase domain-containing protein [Clostridia bacterium]|nr:glucosaminidase domain-containing protein [Clostridia bacterium]
MPAVLIEHGFYTNKEECELLKSGDFREKCAIADAKGILRWAGIPFVQAPVGTPILGSPQATVGQAKAWAKKRGATEEFINLANLYWSIASPVRPEVAYAQAAKETGFGKFGGAVTPDMHNPCGLKVTKPKGDAREDHARFPDWLTGVKAHRDHLALYAGAPGYPLKNTPDPRHFERIKGTATTVEALGGKDKWAPNPDYGKSIVRDYLSDLMATEEDGSAPKPGDNTGTPAPATDADRPKAGVVLVPNAKMQNVAGELWFGDGYRGRGLYICVGNGRWYPVWLQPKG